MAQFEQAEKGTICLIQETEDGRIVQIALTNEQSKMLQIILASISKEKPLVMLGPEYDLILKRDVCEKCSK